MVFVITVKYDDNDGDGDLSTRCYYFCIFI